MRSLFGGFRPIFLAQVTRYNGLKLRSNRASICMAVLGALGTGCIVAANEGCFNHQYLQYTPLDECPAGNAAWASIACLAMLDLCLLYYYHQRTSVTRLAFDFSSTWVAFWRTGMWKLLLMELVVCNLQPYLSTSNRSMTTCQLK